jgi:16S rRNA C967 or C1407 C5-methylase (RsmB/RsmF family)
MVEKIGLLLIVLTLAAGGYYWYTQNDSMSVAENEQVIADMLSNTQVFIDRRQQLERISLNLSLFEDPVFRSLQSYRTEIQPQSIGRDNPFIAPSEDVSE